MREGVPPLAECVSAFLDDLMLGGKSPATERAYRSELRRLPDWPLTDTICRSLIAERLKVSPASARLFRAALSSFVVYCQHRGWLIDSPLQHVPNVKVKPPPHRYLSREQIAAVYHACETDQDRLIIRLLLLGLRAAELLGIKPSDIDGDVLHVRGKGGKHRALPLDPETLALMPLEPMIYRTLNRRVAALGKLAGVPWVRPHDFRRTWSTMWVLETDDLATLQQLGGWSNLIMPRFYARSALEASAVSKAREVGLTGRLLTPDRALRNDDR